MAPMMLLVPDGVMSTTSPGFRCASTIASTMGGGKFDWMAEAACTTSSPEPLTRNRPGMLRAAASVER